MSTEACMVPPKTPDLPQSCVTQDRAITVLIVTHQSADDLDRCLNTLKQAAPRSDMRIRALDNASTDGSVAKLRAAGIEVIARSENTGFAAAVNRLAGEVDTPFLFLLNPDCAPLPGAIDALIDAALALPEYEMFCGRTLFEDGRENTSSAWGDITPRSALFQACGLSGLFPRSAFWAPEVMPDWDRRSDREVPIATGCALLIRTQVWRALQGFDPRYWLYGEEAELQLRMVRTGYRRPWFVSKAHFIHDNSAALRPDATPQENLFRSSAVLRGRATFMRHAWQGAARHAAGPILLLTALRHRVQALAGGPQAELHLQLWRTRAEWMGGYPNPERVTLKDFAPKAACADDHECRDT